MTIYNKQGEPYPQDELIHVLKSVLQDIKRNPSKHEISFLDLLTDKGKAHVQVLTALYSNKGGKYTAMGLIAMYDLGLLKANPVSNNVIPHSQLYRCIKKDLGFRSTRQALDLSRYDESSWRKHAAERKFHINQISEAITRVNTLAD